MRNHSRESSLQRILEQLRQALPDLHHRYAVVSMSVFGSQARESSGPLSDVDALVEFTRPPGFFRFVELEDELSRLLGVKVDLVLRSALRPKIRQRVLDEAVRV